LKNKTIEFPKSIRKKNDMVKDKNKLKSTNVTYWEGAVKVKGTYKGRSVEGKGYVKLTGYDKRFRPKI
jgi:predicted secreted hydrolase